MKRYVLDCSKANELKSIVSSYVDSKLNKAMEFNPLVLEAIVQEASVLAADQSPFASFMKAVRVPGKFVKQGYFTLNLKNETMARYLKDFNPLHFAAFRMVSTNMLSVIGLVVPSRNRTLVTRMIPITIYVR